MTLRIYQRLMACLEMMKPIGSKRSSYKLVRIYNIFIYYLVSKLENFLILHISVGILNKNIADKKRIEKYITASLTTFPSRIIEVRYAILSILFQTVRPDKVILWLAEEQFPEKKIPQNLCDLCQYGLEVRFCDDLRSHKKYYYALKEQMSDELVITFDDDIIYHPHTIERLLQKHKEYPDSIICSQVHIMSYDQKHQLNIYEKWRIADDFMDIPNENYMPLTGSGCLYPYGVMLGMIFNKKNIRNFAFTADDLWIGFWARKKGILICPTEKVSRLFSVIGSSQMVNLSQVNCIGDGNDSTLRNLQKEFGEILMNNAD